MLISGIQPFTLLDFPGRTACIVFTAGCHFRCGYCHNPEFVLPELLKKIKSSFIPEKVFLKFLDSRGGLLDGVVVSGGEPTIQPDLLQFLSTIKALGYQTKLDSNGNNPAVIGEAIGKGLVDYIAMDVKTSFSHYATLVGPLVKPDYIEKSVELIKANTVDYEFRITLIKEIHTPEILADLACSLRGAKRLYLQTFRPGITLDPKFGSYHPFDSAELQSVQNIFNPYISQVLLR